MMLKVDVEFESEVVYIHLMHFFYFQLQRSHVDRRRVLARLYGLQCEFATKPCVDRGRNTTTTSTECHNTTSRVSCTAPYTSI